MIHATTGMLADRLAVGGKAYNLMHLRDVGFPVPAFFVLPADAFRAFLGEQYVAYRALLEDHTGGTRREITELIAARDLSDAWRAVIDAQLDEVFGPGELSLAVRSSATDEDSANHSFAGMMDSFLYVDRASVPDRIKDCYLSAFSERITKYRADHGLLGPDVAVAVVIQRMIDPDAAGVIFTADPRTNNPDEMLISLVHGAGESLVSGASDSDDYVLDFFGNILDRPASPTVSIGDDLLLRLGEMAAAVEESYPHKCPQDIEFCLKDGDIYLLQARPVTPAAHIDKRKPRTILDNSNIIESYSGVTTPLTFTFAREVYAKVYNQTLKSFFVKQESIDEIRDDLQNMLCFYENKVYYRLNSWYRMTSLYPGYETNKKYMENMMGVKTVLHESPRAAKTRLVKIYLRILYKLIRIKHDSEAFKARFNEVTAPYYNNDFEGYSSEALLGVYRELEEKILDDFITPITNDMATMVIFGMLTDRIKERRIPNHEGLISDILARQGEVESVEQSTGLLSIVRRIKASPALLREFTESDIDALKANLQEPAGLYVDIAAYIHRYGARTMDELKLETVTLLEDPAFLFATVKQYLTMDADPSLDRAELPAADGADAALSTLLAAFPRRRRWMIRLLVRLTKYFIRNRESLRLRRTYIYSIVRKIYLGIGRNFAADGRIADRRDIFFLTKEEITRLVEGTYGDTSDVRAKIAARKTEYEENRGKPVYERMNFYGDVTPAHMLPVFSRNQMQNRDGLLTGVAGGGRVVEGTVKLVTDPADADVKGYILMARRTDPGWTVIFPMAEAIIIERGSVLSHSAVVAREMGLTLVVGIRGLCDTVRDGDRVRVDGVSGTVEILERGSKS